MLLKTYTIAKIIKVNFMGKLIIDGNSVFEIDEECLKKRKPDPNCDIEKYMKSKENLTTDTSVLPSQLNNHKEKRW